MYLYVLKHPHLVYIGVSAVSLQAKIETAMAFFLLIEENVVC